MALMMGQDDTLWPYDQLKTLGYVSQKKGSYEQFQPQLDSLGKGAH